MNKVIATLTLALATVTAHAAPTKQLECGFTEPFYTLKVDLQTQVLTKTEYDWNEQDPNSNYITTVVATGVKLISTSSDALYPTFDLVDGTGLRHATLEMNMQGSDGMSDVIFPISIKHEPAGGGTYYGGCSTDKLKEFDPNAN